MVANELWQRAFGLRLIYFFTLSLQNPEKYPIKLSSTPLQSFDPFFGQGFTSPMLAVHPQTY